MDADRAYSTLLQSRCRRACKALSEGAAQEPRPGAGFIDGVGSWSDSPTAAGVFNYDVWEPADLLMGRHIIGINEGGVWDEKGAGILAKHQIHCGRSIARYVEYDDLIESVRIVDRYLT